MSRPPSVMDDQRRITPRLVGIVLSGLVGNVMEWYDFAVYGYFATVIGQLFFPAENPAMSLVASFGAFAAGFVARPLGGLLFGRIGDRVGRERAMMVSVLAMAIPTLLMCLLPTYQSVGIVAPVLLIALRIVQGLSVGGEFTSSMIFLSEQAPPKHRSFIAIWGNWGATAGILLGSGVGLLVSGNLTEAQLEAWGWRIPFALGGVVAMVGWWVRRHLRVEIPIARSESPVKVLFSRHRGAVLRVALLNSGISVAFYTTFIYAVSYIRSIDRLPESLALELNTLSMLVLLLVLPISAWLADRYGSRGMLNVALGLLTVLAIPLFQLLHSPHAESILIGEVAFALLVGMASSGVIGLNTSLIPHPVRCTGLAFAYNAASLFGGTTPMIAAWLINTTHTPLAPAGWLFGAVLLSTLTLVLAVPKTLATD